MSETNDQHLASQDNDYQDQRTIDGRPLYSPSTNDQSGPDEREAVIGQSDLPRRAAGTAGEQAGAGVPGLGGSPGGTSNYGGVGLPGGAQSLGAGASPTDDPRLGGTLATGGLGTGGQPASGLGSVGETEVLPGGATRPTSGPSASDSASASAASHEYAVTHADQGALAPDRGAMITDQPGGAAANDVQTRGDEAATLERSARGNLGPDARPLPIPPTPPAPTYGTDGGPAQSGSLAETPQTDPMRDRG